MNVTYCSHQTRATVLKIGFPLLAICAAATVPAVAATPSDAEMIPWVEFNTPELTSYDAFVAHDDTIKIVEGIREWSAVADKVVVSTGPGKSQMYPWLAAKLSDDHINVTIVPGFKTSSVADDGCHYDDPSTWALVAQEVQQILAVHGSTQFVLENEKLFCCYYLSGSCAGSNYCDCDYSTLDTIDFADGLAYLPTGVEYLWWPSITGSDMATQNRCAQICQVVVDTLGQNNVRFFTERVCNPASVNDSWAESNYDRLCQITTRATIPILYIASGQWLAGQINGALCHAIRCHAFVEAYPYPGFDYWDVNSELIVQAYQPTYQCCPDVDCNGLVNVADLAALLTAYGSILGDPNYNPSADFDEDGDVDVSDLAFLTSRYNSACW
jgi:hypothetical protein